MFIVAKNELKETKRKKESKRDYGKGKYTPN